MIEYRTGDLFEQEDLNALAQVCNIYHTMGAGVAKLIKEKFPAAYESDLRFAAKGDEAKLGFVSVAQQRGYTIGNLYAQRGIGNDGSVLSRNLDYNLFHDSLYRFKEYLEMLQYNGKLGMPYGCGAGLAGGDWSIVEAIINSVFAESKIPVVIVKLPSQPPFQRPPKITYK